MSQFKGLFIEGDVYVDPWDDNQQSTGFLGPINTSKLALSQPEPDKKMRVSNMRGSVGQALGVKYTPKPTELSIDVDDQPPEVLQMVFMGRSESFAQTPGTATDAPVMLIPGRWQRLPAREISESGFSVAKASTPAAALVEDTDYLVDREKGLIKAVVGGAISVATPCLVDYGCAAVDGTLILGNVRTVIQCGILQEGRNIDSGKKCRLEIHQAELHQSGDIDLAKRDYISTTLKGMLITPAGLAAPYTYLEY